MNFQTFYSPSSILHPLRLSARVHFCDICENYFFSLIYADLKTQIYADFFLRLSARVFSANICENYFFSLIYADYQLITNNLLLTTDN